MNALADPDEVRAHLVAAASAGHALTYADLLERLGYSFSRPKMRQLVAVLAEVDRRAEADEEPALAVLVVRQSDGLPGQGWWIASARELGYEGLWEGPEAQAFIAATQNKVFRFWSETGHAAL